MGTETGNPKQLVVDVPLQQADAEMPEQIKIRLNRPNISPRLRIADCGCSCGSVNGQGAGA